MILRIRWKFLALLVLFAQFFEQGVVLRHDCVRRGRSLWRVDGRWRHRDYVIGGWGDPVAILGMFGQVFLPVVLLAAITAGVAYCRVMCTLMTGQTGPVTQRFSADIANVPACKTFHAMIVSRIKGHPDNTTGARRNREKWWIKRHDSYYPTGINVKE